MPEVAADTANTGRLEMLLGFLGGDPRNASLLSEAAETAMAQGRPDVARDLLDRLAALAPLDPHHRNLAGLAAMRAGNFADAAKWFEGLLSENPDEPALRFNLAWCLATLRNTDGASALLDSATLDALPQAAALHVQLLHDKGDFEDAAAEANRLLETYPDHPGLLAAASVLALDVDDAELARSYALRAGSHPDALTTLGTLALADLHNAEAMSFFAQALERDAYSPRAWVGKGLSELAAGSNATAAHDLQHGAELFGRHVGSWIAAGWAHIMTSELAAARSCFDKAYELDRNFGETHGSLAVLNILEGRIDEARRLATTGLRLDPRSMASTLAQALLLSSAGRPEAARAIIERAMRTPIDSTGRTLSSVLAKLAH